MSLRRINVGVCGVALALSLCACSDSAGPGASAAPPSVPTDVGLVFSESKAGEHYVALGDSAASGPLIPMQRTDPASCLRSDVNYPSVLAGLIGAARFQDMTCSSALVTHLFEAQSDNPPQLDALRADTTLVTLGPMGANDVGTTEVFTTCGTGQLTLASCESNYPRANGRDKFDPLLEKVAADIGRGLTEIRRRSPKARVFVVGYGTYFPPDGCFPIQPYLPEPSNYIQGLQDRVSVVLQQQARLHGAEFVSLQGGDALQHTSCALPTQRWLEGLVPTTVALDFHPSALGMQNYAALVQTAINN